jgi:hypothetical protein
MTIKNDDSNNEIFDMGTFNLEGDSNNQTFPDDLNKHLTAEDIKKGGKPLVNTVMKEVRRSPKSKFRNTSLWSLCCLGMEVLNALPNI